MLTLHAMCCCSSKQVRQSSVHVGAPLGSYLYLDNRKSHPAIVQQAVHLHTTSTNSCRRPLALLNFLPFFPLREAASGLSALVRHISMAMGLCM